MKTVCHGAYLASTDLAREKGSFPFFDRDAFVGRPFIQRLPMPIRDRIAETGLRNSHLTAIAPAGTISLLAHNVSSGIEPVFDFNHRRRIRALNGTGQWYELTDYALRQWRQSFGDRPLPPCFVDAKSLSTNQHLLMQAALQPFVDNAISKTINVAADMDFARFRTIYEDAYRHGLKGCTTYRPNPTTRGVLEGVEYLAREESHCCGLDRESD